MFQLTVEETESLRPQIATSNVGRGGRQYFPYELMATHKDLARKIDQLEASHKQYSRTQQQHSIILEAVVKDIQKLKYPPTTRAIGFVVRPPKKK